MFHDKLSKLIQLGVLKPFGEWEPLFLTPVGPKPLQILTLLNEGVDFRPSAVLLVHPPPGKGRKGGEGEDGEGEGGVKARKMI